MVRPVRYGDKCKYCGDNATCRDHVIPRSYLRNNRKPNWGGDYTVHSCEECNLLLGDKLIFSIQDRAKFLLEQYQARRRFKISEKRLHRLARVASQEYKLPETKKLSISPKLTTSKGISRSKCKAPRRFESIKPDAIEYSGKCVALEIFTNRVEAELANFLMP